MTPPTTDPPRVAILGCGAVAERGHLPAFAHLQLSPALLIDRDLDRAERFARPLGVPTAGDYHSVLDQFDAAILALPHHLHANVAVELLALGKHVLVEPPMALSADACETMLAAAEAADTVLAVGHVRRQALVNRWVKAALEANLLDTIRSFDLREGHAFDWPAASDFYLRREAAGGGVLLDLGCHLLDLLLWWLPGPASVDYKDDEFGGVEAEAEARLKLSNYADGVVELSRTRRLRNTAILRGNAGTLEVSLTDNRLTASPTSLLEQTFLGHRGDRLPAQPPVELFAAQLGQWLEAIRMRGSGEVAAGAAAVRLTERLYEARERWELPWVKPDPLLSGALG